MVVYRSSKQFDARGRPVHDSHHAFVRGIQHLPTGADGNGVQRHTYSFHCRQFERKLNATLNCMKACGIQAYWSSYTLRDNRFFEWSLVVDLTEPCGDGAMLSTFKDILAQMEGLDIQSVMIVDHDATLAAGAEQVEQFPAPNIQDKGQFPELVASIKI